MVDKTKNRLVQVKVTNFAYEYMKKYSDMFGISISRFAEMAINDKIIKNGGLVTESEK